MIERLAQFLAREYDGRAAAANPGPGEHPDENLWALLAEGLISPAQRDALLAHAQRCAACRRRMAVVVKDWDAAVTIADGAPAAGWADAETARASTPSTLPFPPLRALLRRPASRLALAAAVVLAVTATWVYYPRSDPAAILGKPIARLTDVEGIGIVRRHTLSADGPADEIAAIEKLAADLMVKTNDAQRDADLWYALGRAQSRLARFDRAIVSLRRAAAIEADRADVLCALGMAHYRAKQYAEASTAFARAIQLDDSRADYHLDTALALEELQQIDKATTHWRRFLELAPDDPLAEEVRRWLKILNGP